jgi:AcrR family transcriptional regulator
MYHARTMTADLGLRERKKQRTRALIADTARRLFVERGFDAVTVTEIARAAEVAQKTVFNYFPTKEDLVYWRLETFEDELLEAIGDREPGESALAAFGRFVLVPRGLLAEQDPEAAEHLAALTRMITASPALLERERQILERYTASLAALIAEETAAGPDDVEPWVAARALIGVHRTLLDRTRRGVLAGRRGAGLATEVRSQAERALAQLEHGLGGYAIKPPSGSKRVTSGRAERGQRRREGSAMDGA